MPCYGSKIISLLTTGEPSWVARVSLAKIQEVRGSESAAAPLVTGDRQIAAQRRASRVVRRSGDCRRDAASVLRSKESHTLLAGRFEEQAQN